MNPLRQILLGAPVATVLQAVGYSLIGAGVLGAALSAAAISDNHLRAAGTSALGVSFVGVGFAAAGARRVRDAIHQYNEMSDETGLCAPVW
jgi:hypothetical protein